MEKKIQKYVIANNGIDIHTADDNFQPVCWNGNKNCHHQPAPRGSKTGTQGRKGSYERSRIPDELCINLINSAKPE